jgi:hypothetical protein
VTKEDGMVEDADEEEMLMLAGLHHFARNLLSKNPRLMVEDADEVEYLLMVEDADTGKMWSWRKMLVMVEDSGDDEKCGEGAGDGCSYAHLPPSPRIC